MDLAQMDRDLADVSPMVRESMDVGPMVKDSADVSPMVRESMDVGPLVKDSADVVPMDSSLTGLVSETAMLTATGSGQEASGVVRDALLDRKEDVEKWAMKE